MKTHTLAYFVLIAIGINVAPAYADDWTKIVGAVPPMTDEWSGEPSDFTKVISLNDGRTLVAIGLFGLIRTSEDGGLNWENRQSHTRNDLLGITALSDQNTLIAVGAAGTVLRSRNRGQTWDLQTTQSNQDLYGVVAMPNREMIVAVGNRGAILRGIVSENRIRWDALDAQGDKALLGIVAVGNKMLIAVGAAGTVLRGTVTGNEIKWDYPIQPSDREFSSIAVVPESNIVVVVGGTLPRLGISGEGTVLQGSISPARFRNCQI